MSHTAEQQDLPIFEHLTELRKRVIISVSAIFLAFVLSFFFSKEIYQILASPLSSIMNKENTFITTHPLEAWLTYLKVSLLSGFFLASPVLFSQIWLFISPGLYKKEKRTLILFVFLSSLFFIGGALFGYFIVFPMVFNFFMQILEGTGIQFLPKMDDYFSFSSKMLLCFGLVFELPLFVYFLAASGLVSFKTLFAFQRYIVVIGFVVGAILTPPDVISQILMSIPIVILYEIGLIGAWFHRKKDSATFS